jgi:MOB kinase activator 1
MDKIKGVFNLDSSKTGTMKKHSIKDGSKASKLSKLGEASLGSGNLRKAVKVPDGEDVNEWFAFNVIDFFNKTSMIYETVRPHCTKETCPEMKAGDKFEFKWADGVKVKKPITCSASEYVDYLLDWVQDLLENEDIFPQDAGKDFPKNFKNTVSDIFRRLFRVYAHIYHHHHDNIKKDNAEAHLNTSFKHFIFYCDEFDLIPDAQLAPLAPLIEELRKKQPRE